jgi:hypothetical protein
MFDVYVYGGLIVYLFFIFFCDRIKTMKHDEATLQADVCKLLTHFGLYYFCVPNDLLGKSRGAALRMARYKAIGLRSGISDLVIIGSTGVAHFLEIKTKTGKQSEAQKNFEALCLSKGWNYSIARSLDDVARILVVWGLC